MVVVLFTTVGSCSGVGSVFLMDTNDFYQVSGLIVGIVIVCFVVSGMCIPILCLYC